MPAHLAAAADALDDTINLGIFQIRLDIAAIQTFG
jgi:hypothetical protein